MVHGAIRDVDSYIIDFHVSVTRIEEEEKHEESFLASHLLVAVWHIFPRCLLKTTSCYPCLTLLKVGRTCGKQRTLSSSNIQSVWSLQIDTFLLTQFG